MRIRALVCVLSVRMPIWAPVRLIALWPSEWIAMAIRATLTCSPVDSSMSISRAAGRSVICVRQIDQLVGAVAHGADDHHDLIALLLRADRLAGGREDLLAVGHAGAAEFLHDQSHSNNASSNDSRQLDKSPPAVFSSPGKAHPRNHRISFQPSSKHPIDLRADTSS